MSRQIKDIKDKNTGLLIYPKTHIKAVVIDDSTYLEDFIGTDVGNRLNKLESTIITNGDGNSYLTNDGSYKNLDEYQKISQADAKYATITTVEGIDDRLEIIEDKAATKEELNKGLSGKVDIIEGKLLSTEDFTSALKAKLESLNNYNDTEINEKVDGIQSLINTLVNKDASAAINTFNEIITFLEGVENTENLDNIIASIEQLIAAINTTLNNYLTKTDASSTYLAKNAKAVSATSADSATKATQDASGNVITSTYATKTELSGKASTSNATQSAAGLMSASDKTKLDGIASGATAVTTNTVSSWGYTKNTGTVTGVNLGSTSYSPDSGVVSLPAYPTTLPASDVYAWAKASSKPTYGWTEITGRPTLAAVATSGSYNDLSNKPTIPTNNNLLTNGAGYTKNTGTVTSVATGVGLVGGPITTSGTVKAKLRSETALTVDSAAATTTSGRVYPVAVDKSGYLSVNVPWSDTNTNTTYSAGTGLSLSGTTFSVKYGTTAGTACQGNDSRLSNSRPASDVYSWAKASTKPTYTYSEVGAAPASHTHNYAGSSSAGGAATSSNKLNAASNSITSTTNDTTAKWGQLGNTVHYYSALNQLIDQPNQYGLVLNLNNNGFEVHQLWLTQASGNIYHRGGNASGWSGSWRTLLDSSNYTSYAATASHTHSYAGSSSAGGSATSAVKLDTATAGSATQPCYFTGGKPTACTYTLGKSVPSNAVFTDTNTHYTTRIYAGASGTAANAAATSPYIKITDDNTYRNQIRLVGGGATTVTSDASGNITISSTDNNTTYSVVGANGTTGLVKNGSSVTSSSGYTACPIISGVPYYKDTNTTYSAATTSALGLVKIGSNISVSSGTISLSSSNVTSALGYTPDYVAGLNVSGNNLTITSKAGTATNTLTAVIKGLSRIEAYTTASTVASLNVEYKTIYVTLSANASLSASATGSSYNGRSVTAYVYTSAARTITIPTSGNYVSMCGSSYTTKAAGWVEFNLTCVDGKWHIAKLEQE